MVLLGGVVLQEELNGTTRSRDVHELKSWIFVIAQCLCIRTHTEMFPEQNILCFFFFNP